MIIEYLNEIMTIQKDLDTFVYRYQILLGASLGMLLVILRNVPQMLWHRFVNMVTIRLVIDESDNMAGYGFKIFNHWVKDHRLEWLTRSFEVDITQRVVGGDGFTAFFYKGKLFWTTMQRRETKGMQQAVTIGSYVVHTMKWNRSLLDDLVIESCTPQVHEKIAAMYIPKPNDRYLDEAIRFPPYVKKQRQYISSKTYDQLFNIFEDFAKGPEQYISKTMPYKETILLYGPPGTGKTNLLRHLATVFNFDLVVINPADLNSMTFKIEQWGDNKLPRIFMIEDIDSNKSYHITPQADDKGTTVVLQSGIGDDSLHAAINGGGSLTDLLNSLDGVVPLDNCIVVMTTNRLERLEPSIYRPGRVDHLVYMGYMDYEGVLEILEWDSEDERRIALSHSHNRDQLPAATINRLRYAKTAKEVEVILNDKNAAIGTITYDKAA